MKKLATTLATVAFLLPAAAFADVGGYTGPDCVRLWTHALKTSPAPNSLGGMMRQTYANAPPWITAQDPIEFIAGSCHLDRALTAVVVKDEVEASQLSHDWNMPGQSEARDGLPASQPSAESRASEECKGLSATISERKKYGIAAASAASDEAALSRCRAGSR